MDRYSIKAQPLSAAAFKPYGDVIEVNDQCTHFEINQGNCVRYHDLANIDVEEQGGQAIVSLFQAKPMQEPFFIKVMERHPLASQAFIPLNGQRYLVIVGQAGDFNPLELQAFIAEPGQGVNYARGTWHHYCLPLEKDSQFLVIDRGGEGDNCDEVAMPEDNEYQVLLET